MVQPATRAFFWLLGRASAKAFFALWAKMGFLFTFANFRPFFVLSYNQNNLKN